MLGLSAIDFFRISFLCLSLAASIFLFYLAYDIGRDGQWRENWAGVIAECFLGTIAIFLGVGMAINFG